MISQLCGLGLVPQNPGTSCARSFFVPPSVMKRARASSEQQPSTITAATTTAMAASPPTLRMCPPQRMTDTAVDTWEVTVKWAQDNEVGARAASPLGDPKYGTPPPYPVALWRVDLSELPIAILSAQELYISTPWLAVENAARDWVHPVMVAPPQDLALLHRLTALHLYKLNVTPLDAPDEFAPSVFPPSLRHLRIVNCRLRQVPYSFRQLHMLETLDLSHNELHEVENVPPCLSQLTLDHNPLHTLPNSKSWAHKLHTLSLRETTLKYLPPSLLEHTALRKLDLYACRQFETLCAPPTLTFLNVEACYALRTVAPCCVLPEPTLELRDQYVQWDMVNPRVRAFLRSTAKHHAEVAPRESLSLPGACCVCLTHGAVVAMIPCGHVCCCDVCATQVLKLRRACPVCRTTSHGTLELFA